MAAPALLAEASPDPIAALRAVKKMRSAGFALSAEGGGLVVIPSSRLTDQQRAYLRDHKTALVGLLGDAETLYRALVQAGPAGLAWREGTPADWDDDRLLAAGEVLYTAGRMVNRQDRRYSPEIAPADGIGHECPHPAESPEIAAGDATATVMPIDREAYEERAAIMEFDGGLPRDEAERKALALAIRAENREPRP